MVRRKKDRTKTAVIMGNVLQRKMKKIPTGIWTTLFMALGAGVCLLEMRHFGRHLLDSDASAEMVLASVLNRTHEFLISKEWYYSTELRVLNTQIGYQIGLLLSPDNWHRARMIADVLFLAVYIASIQFFSSAALRKRERWFLCILLFPFAKWYSWNVLFLSYYIPHIVISFFSLGFFLRYVKAGDRKKRYGWAVLLAALALVAGLGGIRQLMVCYVPLFLTGILFNIGFLGSSGGRLRRRLFSGGTLALLASGIGYLVNTRILQKAYSFQSFQGQTWEGTFDLGRFAASLSEFLSLSGWQGGVKIFSTEGIGNALILLLVGAGALLILRVLFRSRTLVFYEFTADVGADRLDGEASGDPGFHRKEKGLLRAFILWFAVILFLICWALFSFTDHNVTHWIPVLPFAVAAATIGLEDWIDTIGDPSAGKHAALLCYGLLLLAVGIGSVFTFRQPYPDGKEQDDHEHILQAADWLEKENLTQGYATFWNSDVITELTDGRTGMWTIESPEGLTVFPWLQEKDHLDRKPEGTFFVLLTDEEFTSAYGGDERMKEHIQYQDGYYDILVFENFSQYETAGGASQRGL